MINQQIIELGYQTYATDFRNLITGEFQYLFYEFTSLYSLTTVFYLLFPGFQLESKTTITQYIG